MGSIKYSKQIKKVYFHKKSDQLLTVMMGVSLLCNITT